MPTVSNAVLNRMERAERELEQIRLQHNATPFAEAFRDNVWLVVNTMPRAEWPTWVESAYAWARQQMPTSADCWEELRK